MIQQQHLTAYPTAEKGSGKVLTIPGQTVDLVKALQSYTRNSLEEKVKGYYEKEGMPIPDFHHMDKIQRLQALSDYRTLVDSKVKEVKDISGKVFKAREEEKEKLVKEQKTASDAKQ